MDVNSSFSRKMTRHSITDISNIYVMHETSKIYSKDQQ